MQVAKTKFSQFFQCIVVKKMHGNFPFTVFQIQQKEKESKGNS